VSLVKYELGFYIPEDDILHSHRRENLKSYLNRPLISGLQTETITLSSSSSSVSHEVKRILFQAQYSSENLVVPEIELGTSGSVGRNSHH
jgi:hypothetical protein